MRVAVVCPRYSAPEAALRPIVRACAELGVSATLVDPDQEEGDFSDYDIAHFGCTDYALRWLRQGGTTPPMTVNIWNLGNGGRNQPLMVSLAPEFSHVFVDDIATLQGLGYGGITTVSIAPMVPDLEKFRVSSAPAGFSVGTLATVAPAKRLEIIAQGCRLSGAEFLAYVFPPPPVKRAYLVPERSVYPRISVYVHASFVDTDSLPVHEALACGRPVVATHSEGVHRVLADGKNGFYFDGSAADLAEKLRTIRDDYSFFCLGALETKFPSPLHSAEAYVKAWRRLL